MKLKNMMENKQLDFNQPFLSVRRFSSLMETSAKEVKKLDDNDPWPPKPNLPVYRSELKSGPVRNPGTVPFQWEQAPGRPKDDEKKSQIVSSKRPSISPKRPPGRMPSNSNPDKRIVKYETLREKIERELNSSSEEGGDEAYHEALDTLSRSESHFMNCSVTGLSGFDNVDDVKSPKPGSGGSGKLSMDQQTHELMMGRFLPAAMAMASETPQVANRKQNVQREQQREARKVVKLDKDKDKDKDKKHSLNLRLSYYGLSLSDEEIESGDSYNNLVGSEFSSAKACGLFSRFCFLNPIPGMRIRGLSPHVSSAHSVQNGNSISTRSNKNHNVAIGKQNDGNHIVLKGESNKNRIGHRSDLLLHNEQHRRERRKFRELLADESGSASPIAEKTLYVDSMHKLKYQSSNSSPLDMTDSIGDDDHDKSTRSTVTETTEIHQLDAENQFSPHNVEDENKISLRSKSMESNDSCFLSCSGRSSYDAKSDLKASVIEQDDDSFQDSISFTSSKAGKRVDLENNLRRRVLDPKNSLLISSRISLSSVAPPLPKSPSESWLKRTLPTIAARNLTNGSTSTLAARISATRKNKPWSGSALIQS